MFAGLIPHTLAYLVLLMYIIVLNQEFREHILESEEYVCSVFTGRLGNRMFQYAALYGIAKKTTKQLSVIKDLELVKYFMLPAEKDVFSKRTCQRFTYIKEKGFAKFDQDLLNLRPGKNYKILNYLQSWKYFGDYFEDIREEFKFTAGIEANATQKIKEIRASSNKQTVVGIHIRRGDITSSANSKLGYQTTPVDYIHKAMHFMTTKYQDIVFVVCSDDKDYARKATTLRNSTVVYMQGSEIEDFAILAHSDHVITTTGTFGWWAGFLSRGTVIYYVLPYRLGSTLGEEFSHDDFFLKDWIGLK